MRGLSREHLGLPDADDVRRGVIASKIAAHAADVARGLPCAAQRDKSLSVARAGIDWGTHLSESLDPRTAERMHSRDCEQIGPGDRPNYDYCTMCGQKWCSLRINREIQKALSGRSTEKQTM